MVQFYRADKSRILAFQKILSTTCVTQPGEVRVDFDPGWLTAKASDESRAQQGFSWDAFVEILRKGEEKKWVDFRSPATTAETKKSTEICNARSLA
jgi:hypothetical protein